MSVTGLSKIFASAVIIILCLGMLVFGFLYRTMFSEINLFVNEAGAVTIIVLAILTIKYLLKSGKHKQVYSLLLQYMAMIATLTFSNDIYRGLHYSIHNVQFKLGIADEIIKPDELYQHVSIFLFIRVPVPEWDWRLLFGISVLFILSCFCWLVVTIARIRKSGL